MKGEGFQGGEGAGTHGRECGRVRALRGQAARLLVSAITTLSLATPALAQTSYLVIISGIGGDEERRERFYEWSSTMREAALTRIGLPEENVFYLGEEPEREGVHAKSTKENIVQLFDELTARVSPGEQLYLLLIGHGSFRSEESRFNLPGPDLSSVDFRVLLKRFDKQQLVFVNTTSASGGFVAELSGPNRVIVTATKSGFERNEAQFGKYFVEAYAGDGADIDKNGKVSVTEAFNYARIEVERFYEQDQRLKTEHAVLEDDGDGEGVTELAPRSAVGGEVKDGAVAARAFLAPAAEDAGGESAEALAANPELKKLVDKKAALAERIAELRLQKDALEEELYLQELERLLLELAEVTERIEAARTKP